LQSRAFKVHDWRGPSQGWTVHARFPSLQESRQVDMAAKHYKLSPDTGACQRVLKRGKSGTGWEYPNPIGTVCKVQGGYAYHSHPVLRTERGPKKTKAAAIRAVIKDYAVWMGQSAFAGTSRRRRKRK
jgi:hypothetical protein